MRNVSTHIFSARRLSVQLISALFLCCLMFSAAAAQAEPKTYITLPFAISGNADSAHLKDALPQMLGSRLYWKDNFHQVLVSGATAPADEAAVAAAQQAAGADYAIWGTLLYIGANCSLEIKVRDAQGQVWPHAVSTTEAELIPTLDKVADSINADIFRRPTQQGTVQTRVDLNTPLNPELRGNQYTADSSPLNPAMRMASSAADMSHSTLSQTLNFRAHSMAVADLNKDGQLELILVGERTVYVYHWLDGKLAPKGEFRTSPSIECVRVETWDINKDGALEIIVNAYDVEENLPATFVLSWNDGKLTQLQQRIRYYISTMALPPTYNRVLVAQSGDNTRVFRAGVHEAAWSGGQLQLLGRVDLPENANVFNCVWLPSSAGSDEADKIVMLGRYNERLQVYTARGSRVSESDESYSGAPSGVVEGSELPGMGRGQISTDTRYYIPMHMQVADFEGDDVWTVVINRPISTAAKFFRDYRAFPQGKVEALFWDGTGLTMEWDTPIIKASVADIAIVDITGDGNLDLVICYNTHSGVTGTGSSRAAVRVFPFESAKARVH